MPGVSQDIDRCRLCGDARPWPAILTPLTPFDLTNAKYDPIFASDPPVHQHGISVPAATVRCTPVRRRRLWRASTRWWLWRTSTSARLWRIWSAPATAARLWSSASASRVWRVCASSAPAASQPPPPPPSGTPTVRRAACATWRGLVLPRCTRASAGKSWASSRAVWL